MKLIISMPARFALLLLLTAGCRCIDERKEVRLEADQRFSPEFLRLVTPAFFELSERSGQESMMYLHIESADHDLQSENSNQHVFYAVFIKILSLPVVEKPEYWVSVVNNSERSDLLRLYCLRAFFLRHVEPGDQLDKLAAIPGTESWFNEDTIWMVGGLGGRSIFEIKGDEEQVEIRMQSSLEAARIPITLVVKGSTISGPDEYTEKSAEVLDVLRGRKENPKLIITGVAVY